VASGGSINNLLIDPKINPKTCRKRNVTRSAFEMIISYAKFYPQGQKDFILPGCNHKYLTDHAIIKKTPAPAGVPLHDFSSAQFHFRLGRP
jgi:hypothetical protein